jgi:hypothetical protein
MEALLYELEETEDQIRRDVLHEIESEVFGDDDEPQS